MIQNYFILAGLIGIYLLPVISKGEHPEMILVVGILAMFSFSIGLSQRQLSKSEKIRLQVERGVKSYFSFWVGSVLAVIMSAFIGLWALFLGYFVAYQIVSFAFWKAEKYQLKRFKKQQVKHPWLT